MIAYEIQLRHVIRDNIQSETKFSPRQHPRQNWEKNLLEKKFSDFFLD